MRSPTIFNTHCTIDVNYIFLVRFNIARDAAVTSSVGPRSVYLNVYPRQYRVTMIRGNQYRATWLLVDKKVTNDRTFIFSLICMLTELPSYVHEPSLNEQVCSPNGQLVKSTSQNTRYLAGGIQWTLPSDRTTQLIFPYVSSLCPSALQIIKVISL